MSYALRRRRGSNKERKRERERERERERGETMSCTEERRMKVYRGSRCRERLAFFRGPRFAAASLSRVCARHKRAKGGQRGTGHGAGELLITACSIRSLRGIPVSAHRESAPRALFFYLPLSNRVPPSLPGILALPLALCMRSYTPHPHPSGPSALAAAVDSRVTTPLIFLHRRAGFSHRRRR